MVKASVSTGAFLNHDKMKIVLLKDHNGWPAASGQDVTPEQANYLVRCKVAEYADGYTPVVKPVVKAGKPKSVKAPAKQKAKKEAKVVKPVVEKK